MSKALIVATFPKNQRETVRVALDQYQGHNLIDVRVMVPLAAHAAALTVTAKGISMNVALLPELRRALDDAEAQARKLGWVT